VLELARRGVGLVIYFIGTSGWHYDDWRGSFYPGKLPKSRWLDFYTGHFPTVEINNTFYRLPSEKAVANWYDTSPPGFIFSVKVSRYITHVKKLKDIGEALSNFMSRLDLLKEKLGPLLYQLPPGMHRDDDILIGFLQNLPDGSKHVIEFRHQSWLTDEVFEILRRYNIGICVFDMPDFSCPLLATADFAYIRLHGRDSLYSSCYTDNELADWAGRISVLSRNLESVYIYFNNDVAGYALKNAVTIRDYLEREDRH